jgi:hypothetical protein
MDISKLKSDEYLFGNKGAVWSNEAHIGKSGFKTGGLTTTLCGTYMLSSNHAKYQGVKEVGCKECLKKWNEIHSDEEANI